MELFIIFAENSQILLKISVIPILLTFIYLVALNLVVINQLNSSFWHIIVTLISIAMAMIIKQQLGIAKEMVERLLSQLKQQTTKCSDGQKTRFHQITKVHP